MQKQHYLNLSTLYPDNSITAGWLKRTSHLRRFDNDIETSLYFYYCKYRIRYTGLIFMNKHLILGINLPAHRFKVLIF